jgi:hypothetical protein
MVLVLLDKVIDTSYGQFDLCWGEGLGFDGDLAKTFDGQVNGLVGAASGNGLYVNLARWGGGSGVRIVLLPNVASLDAGAWEDVVEVSVAIPPDAEPFWSSWAGEDGGPLDLPPGSYRVRVSACGRDAARGEGEFAEGVVDRYLLEFWSAPIQPDTIIRSTSEDAAYWHRSWGGRR